MKPEYPSIHHGWIKIGNKLKTEDGYDIVEFLKQEEKPDLETATKFFNSGEYLIHSGYMACRPSLLLSFYQQFSPENFNILEKIANSMGTPDYQNVLKTEYERIEKTSVDLGIFVKLPAGTQWELPVEIGWVDMGTWELLYHGLPKDENGNAIVGTVQSIDTKNSLVFSKDNKISGLIGLENMIVVDTAQGLLVCPMEKANKVKELYKLIYEK
jgi:mannose-1-phosphate guanylyltransferase